ncbi:MAG: carboxypeptidase regulatory-like domain-containing protein, partial [Pyrinomonadaceae bacterium]
MIFTTALGQATGGRVRGTVSDTAGAVVPGASVSLRHEATGQALNTQTTDAGLYEFPNVPVGDYTITVEGEGFAPLSQGLKAALNQTSTVDATLQPAGVAGAVEITAAGEALVQTDSSQLASGYDARQVQNLPLFGNQNLLALLSPNVVEQSAGVQGTGGAIGGTRPRGNSFNLDGVDNNDPTITGPSAKVIQDAVQEFTLLTNNYNAEFGAAAGGLFNAITRSGTNEFHGSGFFYRQDEALNAASTLEEAQLRGSRDAKKPNFGNTRFGGTFGGPVVKDRLFFFGSAQRERIDRFAAPTKYSAPTAAGLQQIAALPGASPFVINLLRDNLTLAPNATTTATVLGVSGVPFGEVINSVPSGSTETLSQINVDHLPGTRDQFRYRFSFQRTRAEQPGGGNQKFNNLSAYDTRLFSATWVRAFDSGVVNDLRLSYRRVNENYPLADAAAADFPNLLVTPLNIDLGPNLVLPQGAPVNNGYQVYDAVSLIRGPHTFKFGGEFRRLILSNRFVPLSRGYYDYADLDQLLRDEAPAINQRGVGSGAFASNQSKFYGFAQDDWRVRPSLTLNLGLRYEYVTLPRDLATQELNAAASVPGVVEFRAPRTDKNNFAPRVGL